MISLRPFVVLTILLVTVCALPSGVLAETAADPSEPLILRMADGRFYHPGTGTIAFSREEILRLVGAPVTPPSVAVPSSSVVSSPIPPALDGAPRVVLAARRALSLLGENVQPKRVVKQKPSDWREVSLAIWDPGTDEVQLVTFEKNGNKLRNLPAGIGLSVRGGSGYDTDYAVTPAHKIVVGVRYPGIDQIKQGSAVSYQLRDIVYVPYSKTIHTEEVVTWGKRVLDDLVNRALQDIRGKAIASRAFPGKLLADVADPVALKSIMAIEHLDHRSVGRGADDRLELFYVELALNEGGAFRHDVSSAGANGLLQFIPSTYASMVKRWPTLNLIPDFKAGTADLSNAIKAQIAYLDDVWSDLPAQAKDLKATSPEQMRAYLIAAYNTGGVRVRRAIVAWGSAWDQDYRKEWEKLDAKQTELGRAIYRLKQKVAVEKQATVKKKLTNELAVIRTQHAKVTADLETLDRSRLKAETLGYLYKYRLVAPRMKNAELASL